jgi:hypothetical protein
MKYSRISRAESFPRIVVEALPVAQPLKSHQPDRKQHPLTFLYLAFAGLGNLVFIHSLFMLRSERISSSRSCRRMASSICSWIFRPP